MTVIGFDQVDSKGGYSDFKIKGKAPEDFHFDDDDLIEEHLVNKDHDMTAIRH